MAILNKIYPFAVLLLLSCTLSRPDVKGLDLDQWKNDQYGCNGDRLKMLTIIESQKNNLLGYSQNEIKYFLGKPDEQELYDRSQTFFHYYIKGHETCLENDSIMTPVVLQIRFNALNNSNEVFFRNYLVEESQ